MKNSSGKALIVVVMVALLGMSGCAFITPPYGGGAQSVSSSSTGEAWYVKNQYFLWFLVDSEIYYCDGKGTCKEADVQ